MQGLPTKSLSPAAHGSKMIQGEATGKAKAQALGDIAVDGNGEEATVGVEGKSAKSSKADFASLFENAIAKNSNETEVGKDSKATKIHSDKNKNQNGIEVVGGEVKAENSEAVKHLLTNKTPTQTQSKESAPHSTIKTETKAEISLDSKLAQLMSKSNEKNPQINVEQKIAKTSSNLDQLLNNLKGTQDNSPTNSDDTEVNGKTNGGAAQLLNSSKKGEHEKVESKSGSPLDFLMKETKTKGVGENSESKNPELQSNHKKVMTAEDYLKNLESKDSNSDKKANAKLALLEGGAASLPAKTVVQNLKGYSQGSNLLNDSLIKNTNDLAFKGAKTGKSSSDELLNKDLKVSAELATVKQEAMPVMQNKAHNQESQTQAQANQKVLDLSNINTSNTNEIIKRISDYVEQNQVANKSSLDLTVKHESLGEFKIQVSKMPTQSMNQGLNQIDMQITTSSKEGHDFFVKNEVSLMRNLNQAGINLSDFRILSSSSETGAFGQSDSKQSSSFHQNADGSEKQFASFDSQNFTGDSSNGSERRKELWQEYQERFGA